MFFEKTYVKAVEGLGFKEDGYLICFDSIRKGLSMTGLYSAVFRRKDIHKMLRVYDLKKTDI